MPWKKYNCFYNDNRRFQFVNLVKYIDRILYPAVFEAEGIQTSRSSQDEMAVVNCILPMKMCNKNP